MMDELTPKARGMLTALLYPLESSPDLDPACDLYLMEDLRDRERQDVTTVLRWIAEHPTVDLHTEFRIPDSLKKYTDAELRTYLAQLAELLGIR